MTDILAGSLIQAAAFPATVQAFDDTAQLNLSGTSFGNGTVVVSVTFVAPSSGRVLIYLGGSARSSVSVGGDYVIMGLDLRVGSSGGAVVESPAAQGLYTCRWPTAAVNFTTRQRVAPKSGLTPGQVYYAGHQFCVGEGEGTADITSRHLIVRPLP
ncbi:hypothetical protein E1281_01150 [Actinomadura sp. KC345]|uniref:hypothetical protein n=1 Tax=Actinomadura sp. KC345 TaxID=2530371 RepID=UPI00104F343D|nr:hypothetical protein [Actinomadura sp. KC345]TDC58586.1 hypothetical protein E1281_01150 [Actinomadura sp. KC345]